MKKNRQLNPDSHPEPQTSISTMGFQPRQFNQAEASANFPSFLTCMEKSFKDHQNTDTKVVVGHETFHCHMMVLKCYSEYFEKLEKNQNLDSQSLILPEDQVSTIAFHNVYDWMLSDEYSLPRFHFAELYKAVNFLKIHELKSQIMCYIDDKGLIGERTALSIYLEAKEADEKSLQGLMLNKISKIFLTFIASWEYLMLESSEVQAFFKSNRLGVNSELDMLFASIRWLQHEWPQRKVYVSSIMKLVRWELIQSWQLVELKNFPKELEQIFKITEVQEMIDKALFFISLQCSDSSAGDGDKLPEILSRLIINDQMWNEFEFERNPNFYQNYRNFCKYLNQLDACHWRKIKYADPKYESVVL